jgi:hypothetical protein
LDKPTGQWVLKFWLNDVLCKYSALYKYASKGMVIRKDNV